MPAFSVLALFLLLQGLISGSLGHTPSGNGKNTTPVVTTPLGSLQGTTMTTRRGRTIFAFRGVRYAEPPVEELRFRPPVPVKPWKGIYDATKNNPRCPQSFVNETQEDCLFLNVYTLHANKPKPVKRPVMVYFHPGGFYEGISSSDFYGPQYLLDEDIVIVIPNYRLQTLGFLATGTPEAPGNNGLKDQVQVLRWVQQNIASFSGDPNDVTISGYSAGGLSVTLHLVSPMSKGLFHKAISMSGSVFGNQPPITTDLMMLAKRQAELVNCPSEPPKALVKCLKTKTSTELSNNLAGYKEFLHEPIWLWTAVIEPDFGQERFLVEHPIKSLLNKRVADVPVIIGVTTDEFGGRSFSIVNNQTALDEFDKDYKQIWPIVCSYERDTEFSFKVSEGLRKFYFPDGRIDASKRQAIADLLADGIIGFGANRGAKLLATNLKSKVFYYRFNYKRRYSFFYLPGTNYTVPYGVSHHDDLFYLFYISRRTPMFTDGPDGAIVDKMTSMWGNFIKSGSPDTKDYTWPSYDLKKQEFLDISTDLRTLSKLFEDRYETWEKLFPLSLYSD